jgi:protein SCO1
MKRLMSLLLLITFTASAAAPHLPESLYNLPAKLTSQSGIQHGLDVYEGHPVLITLFYGSCPAACPLLVDTVRATERAAPATSRSQMRVLLISIDPDHDTVKALQALAQSRRIDTTRWTLARTDAATVRKIAALLNIQYRSLPDGSYNHTSIVSLLAPSGVVVRQSTVLGKADPELLEGLAALSPGT